MSYLVFDIGGTNTRLALSEDGKSFTVVKKIATPKKPETFIKEIKTLGATVDNQITVAAGGIRGVLDEDKESLEKDSHLSAWQGFNLLAAIQAAFPKIEKVMLENDTALAGLGEAHFGAGMGSEIMVYHTVSTGVGGVKIEMGRIDSASVGFEPGHQTLDIDRTILGPEVMPTLENLVSGTAVEARLGMKPYEIPQEDVLWNELAGYLAQGLRNSILYWSPEVIVLGGSMILGDPKIPLDRIREETVLVLDGFMPCPFITTGKLGDDVGLYGGLALVHNYLAEKT